MGNVAARRRRVDRGKIIGIVIMVIALVLVVAFPLYSLYLWFKVHKISVNYFVFSLIISIAWAIPLIIFIISLTKYLWQVPPLWRKRIIAYLSFLALFLMIIVVLISYIILVVIPLVSINIVPPLAKSFSIVNATLVMYKLSHCYKVCGGVLLNQTAFNPVGSNETMFVKAVLSQSFIGLFIEIFVTVFLLGLWLLTTYLLKALLEYSTGDKEKAYNTLCYSDRRLLYSYITMTLIIYFTGFSIIVYSLAILSSSEFPYAYAMLITTFLVLIVEVLMIRNGETDSSLPWVALFISVVSSLLYTVVTFYTGGFILPSACFVGVNDVLGVYKFSLLLAGIFGAIPYALMLVIIHHHIMCPRVEPDETKSGT
jgi:hypothetical protein